MLRNIVVLLYAIIIGAEYSEILDNISDNNERNLSIDYKDCPGSDMIWCVLPMPTESLFRFPPPDDEERWNNARITAALGTPVLLNEILKHFPNYLDFLDGDIYFRKHHQYVDFFVDHVRDLKPLTSKHYKTSYSGSYYEWEKKEMQVVPHVYNFRSAERAPVVKLGYYSFSHRGYSQYFQGPLVGEAAIVDRKKLYQHWRKDNLKDRIITPFILLHASNENWGLFSTEFPNRTANWGGCCNDPEDLTTLRQILDHPMVLMLLTNQHYNISHPKIITLPRGIPVDTSQDVFEHGRRIMWDTMRKMSNRRKKSRNLVYLASSNWKYRPIINKCIGSKFSPRDFEGNTFEVKSKKKLDVGRYYQMMANAKFTVALPGLGYDTFRLWESLLLGSIPIIEKGVGLDKTLWRLPALLVEDYDAVTPDLLRTAYVEAIYRAEEFEYERLRQSWWISFIMNVSVAQATRAVIHSFPIESEDPTFTRPLVPFQCGYDGSCGAGTKRIPKSSC